MSIKSDVPSSGSRRHFLAAGAAAGLWPVAAAAQRITANTPIPPPSADQDVASLQARTDEASHLTVAVMVNEKGPFNFVVDTGAERSVISDTLAAALNLPADRNMIVQGIVQALPVPSVRAETVAFGPFVHHDVLLPVLPHATLAADGFLGLDVINGTRVTFDFKHQAVRIEQPRYRMPGDPNLEARVGATGKAGRLQIVDCIIDDVAAVAFIDTGAEISVGNPALLSALNAHHKGRQQLGNIILTGVTGGQLDGQIVEVSRIKLQALAFTDSVLAIADAPDFAAWGLHSRPALLIGMNYLRQFASVAVDYRAKEIRFELSLAPPMPRPGVEIRVLG